MDLKWLEEVSKQKPSTELAPVRVLIYGEPGVGKTTFACSAPNPIVLDFENGTRELNPRPITVPNATTWDTAMQRLHELAIGKHKFKTLVIDSADWFEQAAIKQILANEPKKVKSLNQACGGYGNGRNTLESMHRELFAALDALQEQKGMHIVATAHYLIKETKDPEAVENYDSYKLKLDDKVAALWREWVAGMFFARHETVVKAADENSKTRAIGTGKHVMFTQKRPAFDAKNRYALPFKLPVDWEAFFEARCAGRGETSDDLRAEIEALANEIPDKETLAKIQKAVAAAGDDINKLVSYRNRCRVLTETTEAGK